MSAEWAFGLVLLVVAVVATLHFLRVISIPFLPSHTTAFQVVLDGVAADFTDSRKAAVQSCVARKCSVPDENVSVEVEDGSVVLKISVVHGDRSADDVQSDIGTHFESPQAAQASFREEDDLQDTVVQRTVVNDVESVTAPDDSPDDSPVGSPGGGSSTSMSS